jgi:Glycosyltransferase family 87
LVRRTQFIFVFALLASGSTWFYVNRIMRRVQVEYAAEHNVPRGNLSDLYPRWLGARELLLHKRSPYSEDITREIQQGYYGRPLDPARPDDPKDQQGFAYPVYVVFLLAPLVGFSFSIAQIIFRWILIGLTGVSVLLWLRVLRWRVSCLVLAGSVILTLGSFPAVQGIKLQQLSLLVTALLAASVASVVGGHLFLAGAILALATIKPQLAGPMAAWLLLWALADWKRRRNRLIVGFASVWGALLVASEVVLPGWWKMFFEAVHDYHRYTQNESVLGMMAGRTGGMILTVVAVLWGIIWFWKLRRADAGADQFGAAVALAAALTVLIVPMYAPYNQILLLPAILRLAKWRAGRGPFSPAWRLIFSFGLLTLMWPWLAILGLSAVYALGLTPLALRGWAIPLYANFALPVLVFTLVVLSLREQHIAGCGLAE